MITNFLNSFGIKGTNFIGFISGVSTWIMSHIDGIATMFGIIITVATGIVAVYASIVKTNHQKRMNQLEFEQKQRDNELEQLRFQQQKLELEKNIENN